MTGKSPSRNPPVNRRPVAIDLFAGAGGLTLGFEQAGFDVVASVEYDPVHAAVHAFNFPNAEILCADVSRLSGADLLAAARRGWSNHGYTESLPKIDVIFGGPPCQGFSTIGKRLIDDSRNNLVFHFFRLITEIKPRYFVMENVPGMVLGGHSSILRKLIAEFEDAGYSITLPHRILNSAHYGVPQSRRRLFLLGARRGEKAAGYPMPQFRPADELGGLKNGNGNHAELASKLLPPIGPAVRDAILDLPNLDRFSQLLNTDSVQLSPTQFVVMSKRGSDYVRLLRNEAADPSNRAHPRIWDKDVLTSSARTVHTDLSIRRFNATTPGDTEPISRFLRLDPRGLCNTLRAGTGSERGAYTSPRPIHPELARVISVREAARLHSLPDWFRLHATKWHGFRQVGNSVPPLLGRAVANEIARALGVKPSKPRKAVPLGDPNLLTLTMAQAAMHFGASSDQIPKQRNRETRKVANV